MKQYPKSSFKYWFAHWSAFQMTAMNLGCWKFRFLFHDMEKPFLKVILRDYSKVRKIHRTTSKHHYLLGQDPTKKDFLAMVVDWECCRFTKEDQPLNARQTLYAYHEDLDKYILPILEKLGL